MIRKLLVPGLAVMGIVFAGYVVRTGAKPTPTVAPSTMPPESPFVDAVAGAGIVEASSRNIAVGAPVSGVVKQVMVKVGDTVKAGQALFELDDRDLRAEWAVRDASLQAAVGRLAKLEALPRPEDIPVADAKVAEAEANAQDAEHQLSLAEGIRDVRAMSNEEMARRRFAVASAKAKLAQARADAAELKAGAWEPDRVIARREIASAKALLEATETNLKRLTVCSPVDGQVLQSNVRVGEFAAAGTAGGTPLVMVGTLNPLHLRVDVDENDAWRITPSAKARAVLRGNRDIRVELKFEYIEPFIVPKRSLTGDMSERVDTRVLQVVFSFDRGERPIYIGQQMDAFVDANSAQAAGK